MAKFSELRRGGGADTAARVPAGVALRQALLTPAVATILADGRVEDAELDQLKSLCAFSPIYRDTDGAALEALAEAAHAAIEREGVEGAIAAAAESLSPALRRTALCFAARIAATDGAVDAAEEDVLDRTVRLFAIDAATFDKVCEVVTMMQHDEDA